jgi:hypothetical protein
VEDASGNENAVASSSFTIISSSAVVLSNVAITLGCSLLRCQSINLTWSSPQCNNVKIELFVPAKSGYITLVASTLSDGAESVTIPDTLGSVQDIKYVSVTRQMQQLIVNRNIYFTRHRKKIVTII